MPDARSVARLEFRDHIEWGDHWLESATTFIRKMEPDRAAVAAAMAQAHYAAATAKRTHFPD
jgi:hypothetical protein